MTELWDATTGKLQSIPGESTGIVTVIPSPGTPSRVLAAKKGESRDSVLAAKKISSEESIALLVCRGATLTSGAEEEDAVVGRCLAVCGTVSDCLVVDGVTLGDVELRHSRHARTLSALFRGRLFLLGDDISQQQQQQSLILSVEGYDPNRDKVFADAVQQDMEALFKAIVAECKDKPQQQLDSFAKLYDLTIVPADMGTQVR